jgi:Uma2 family endonuclease
MAVELKRYRFTVDEYEAMGRAGILDEDDRVELIEGEIVEMAPIGPGHAHSVNEFTEIFRFRDVAIVSTQNSIRLGRYNEPQPDLALLRRRADRYRDSLPSAEDVLLAVEVSDTTLAADRGVKVPLYGRAGIPETWVVDLPHDVLHVYREPVEDGYRVVQTLRRGDRVAPLAFPDRELEVAELLG